MIQGDFNTFLYGENYPIIKWEEDENINFWIEQINTREKCPNCHSECTKVKETHKRKIQDTPIHNKNVYINITVREFKCEIQSAKLKHLQKNYLLLVKIKLELTHLLSLLLLMQFI